MELFEKTEWILAGKYYPNVTGAIQKKKLFDL